MTVFTLHISGAPYFAAISALKTGADLVHVMCEQDAGQVIKAYSPELIVHPILDTEYILEEIDQWLPKFHSIVLGRTNHYNGININPSFNFADKFGVTEQKYLKIYSKTWKMKFLGYSAPVIFVQMFSKCKPICFMRITFRSRLRDEALNSNKK